MKSTFLLLLKTSFRSEDILIYICSEFFGQVGKRLDKKAKVKFKLYDVTNWKSRPPKQMKQMKRTFLETESPTLSKLGNFYSP